MGEIASAFVRIRPDLTGFKSEVSGGVREAFGGIAKSLGGAVAAAGAFDFVKGLASAAAKDQAAFVILDRSIRDAHASLSLFGTSVEDTLKKEASLKGFNDEQLAAAFTRLVSVTHNSTRAFSDLQKAEDLSRARGIDLEQSALAVAQAEQGRTTSLSRYGLVVPKVTAAEDALRRGREAAVAAGAKFTAAQNAEYQAALRAASAADKQANKTEALTLIQKRFGGVAQEYANTASGQFARLQEDLHLLEETVGKVFLHGLGSAAQSVGEFALSLAHNEQFVRDLQAASHELGTALHDVGAVAKAVAPTLETIATAAEHVAQTIGAGPILAAVATYKALTIAEGLAATAQAFYARAVQASVGPAAEATAANAALAASETAVAGAGDAAAGGGLRAFARGVGALGLSGAGGVAGLATAGLAVLAGTFVYLASRTDDATRAINAFDHDLAGLAQATQSLPADRLAVAQARLNKQIADGALANSRAKEGSVERQQLLLNEKRATQDLSDAIRRLNTDTSQRGAGLARTRSEIAAFVRGEQDRAQALARGAVAGLPQDDPSVQRLRERKETEYLAQSMDELNKRLRDDAKAQRDASPLIAHNIDLLREFADQANRLPTRREIRFFLNNKNAKAGIADVERAMRATSTSASTAGGAAGSHFATAFWETASAGIAAAASAQVTGEWPGIGQALEAAADASKRDALAGAAHRKILDAAQAAINTLKQGLADDAEQLGEIGQQIADQAVQGPEAIASAIASAQQNFDQIGATIAGDLAQVVQQPFVIAQERMNLEGDRTALAFDRQANKLSARAAGLNAQINQISLAQQARDAKYAGENARIAAEENRIGLRSDKNNLAQLSREIILPGGKTLSSDPKRALAELERYAAHAKGAARLAIQDYIDQYQRASLSVEKDKIGIATEQRPGQAQRSANLQLQATRLSLRQATLDARRAAIDARRQLRADALRIDSDVAAIRARVAAREIADLTDAFARAPTAANMKRVTKKIADLMASDHVSFQVAGARMGTAWLHGFRAQITGLGLQAAALQAPGVGSGSAGGLIPSIVKPLETIRQQQETQAHLAHQQRKIQIDEAKKHTTLLQKIHARQVATTFINKLPPTGKQTAKTKRLAGTTG